MTEKTVSITACRQDLLRLAKLAKRRMNRYILTNKGESEAVLLGIGDYKSLVAAMDMILHPEVLAQTYRGFATLEQGGGLTLEEAIAWVQARRKGEAPSPGPSIQREEAKL